MDIEENPLSALIAIKKRVRREIIYAGRLPNTAVNVLPPSSLPTGSIFKAELTKPAKPTKKRGWIGIG